MFRKVMAALAGWALTACASVGTAQDDPGPIAVYGNKQTFEIAPVLLAAEHYYPGEATVRMGSLSNLVGAPPVPGFGEEGEAEIAKLHDAWRSGNARVIWDEMAVEMREEFPAVYQRINVDRNDAWVPQLEAMLDPEGTGNTLVVVGALHLVGEDGVVEKLEARGYEVERICSACGEQ